jgi:hypothetical protein
MRIALFVGEDVMAAMIGDPHVMIEPWKAMLTATARAIRRARLALKARWVK